MSARAVKWTLWVVALCTAPLPYTLGSLELAPPIRLAFFTGLIAALQVSEGPGGWVWNTLLGLGIVQLVAYAVGLYALAALLARASRRLAPRSRLAVTSALCGAALALALTSPIYETPLSSVAAFSSLRQVFR